MKSLALAAAVLGIGAAFAGSPYAAQHGRIDVNALARAVVHEDDHVDAVELGEWIRERRAGLRIIDVRSMAEYQAYHVPTAERIPLDSLASTPFRTSETIVLYSEGGTHAAQGWVFLRALGFEHVYFLRGGLYDWLEQVLSPSLGVNATAKDSVAFTRVAAISRYFGGAPRFGVSSSDDAVALPSKGEDAVSAGTAKARDSRAQETAELAQKIRKRGC